MDFRSWVFINKPGNKFQWHPLVASNESKKASANSDWIGCQLIENVNAQWPTQQIYKSTRIFMGIGVSFTTFSGVK